VTLTSSKTFAASNHRDRGLLQSSNAETQRFAERRAAAKRLKMHKTMNQGNTFISLSLGEMAGVRASPPLNLKTTVEQQRNEETEL
jgi:hypothetical protein